MLAIWNRKEVMLTNDMERLAKARYALQGAGIVYTLKTKNFRQFIMEVRLLPKIQDIRMSCIISTCIKRMRIGRCTLFRKHCAAPDHPPFNGLQKSMLVLAVMSVRSCRVRYCFNG